MRARLIRRSMLRGGIAAPRVYAHAREVISVMSLAPLAEFLKVRNRVYRFVERIERRKIYAEQGVYDL